MILYLQQSTDTNHSNSVPSFFMWCLLCCTSSRWVYYYIIITRYPRILVDCCVGYSIHHRASTRNFCVASRTLSMMIWWFLLLYLLRLCPMLLIVSAWVQFYYFLSRHHAIDCCIHYYCYCVDTYTSLLMSCHYQLIALQPLIDSWGRGNSCLFDPIPSAMHTRPWRIFVAMISLRAMLQDTHLCNSDWQLLLRIRFPYSVSDSMLMFEIRYGFWCQMSAIRFDTWFRCRCLTLFFTDIRFNYRFWRDRFWLIVVLAMNIPLHILVRYFRGISYRLRHIISAIAISGSFVHHNCDVILFLVCWLTYPCNCCQCQPHLLYKTTIIYLFISIR